MEPPILFPNFFMWMGPYKWPLFLIALIVALLIIKKVIDFFFIKEPTRKRLAQGLNAILFWGSMALAMGIFAQLAGIYIALNEIMRAPDLSPPMILIGFYGSFMPTLFGLGILVVAALSWWLLRYRLKSHPAD